VKFDDAGAHRARQVRRAEAQIVLVLVDGRAGALQQGIVAGGENVGPREAQEEFVVPPGPVIVIGDETPDEGSAIRSAEGTVELTA
jgi:hypothetical protein